jgi:hypothetical protein
MRRFEQVCLVIATFRQDEAVIGLLDELCDEAGDHPFGSVIVVDSQGSGRIAAHVEVRGLKRVSYESAAHNLGSAGNLARRLELAAQTVATWAYAINHDGELRWEAIEALVSYGERAQERGERVGALYPLRYTTRLGKYNLTGKSSLPIPYIGTKVKPTEESFRVWWASSNGALYALAPVREGLLPWAQLWMGWEDLGYGWLLASCDWTQHVVTGAIFEDGYEYKAAGRGAGRVQITDKPTWYAYYQVRNMILITRWCGRGPLTWGMVAWRVTQEVVLTGTLRPDKQRRLSFLLSGLRDGLLGRSGKWRYP